MNFLENAPNDILTIIFDILTDKRILPLQFVSKTFNILTREKIKETKKFYLDFLNAIVKDDEIELFKWCVEIKCPINNYTIQLASKNNNFELLKYVLKNEPLYVFDMINHAIKTGNIEILEWLNINGCIKASTKLNICVSNATVCESAVESGNIEILKWVLEHTGCGGYHACESAVKKGAIDMLKLMIENGIKGYMGTTIYGHVLENDACIETLEYLRNIFQMSRSSCAIAAVNERYIVLEWLKTMGCEWDSGTSAAVAMNGDLQMLERILQSGCPVDENLCIMAASRGHLEIIQWARRNNCPWDKSCCITAMDSGHFKLAKWLIENNCPCPLNICDLVVNGGRDNIIDFIPRCDDYDSYDCNYETRADEDNLEVLKWLINRGFKLFPAVCEIAAQIGNLTILSWAIENGCAWDDLICEFAAQRGHLHILKFAKENGYSLGTKTCKLAAATQQFKILKWLYANGCELCKNICMHAANNCDLRMLKWARERNCEWDARVCEIAARNGQFKILRWSRENGCDWCPKTCSSAAKYGHPVILKWVLANGCPWDYKLLTSAQKYGDMKTTKWIIKNYCHQGLFVFMGQVEHTKFSQWSKKYGFVVSEQTQPNNVVYFSKYIPEGAYCNTKKYVFLCDDITRSKRFVLEKAREKLKLLENEINAVSNITEIENIADLYFSEEESHNSDDSYSSFD